MKSTEAAVLAALAPGGILTSDQIRRHAALTSWRTRQALVRLRARGLIVPDIHRARWQISARGRSHTAARI